MNKEDLHIDDFFRSELEGLPGEMNVPSWEKVRGNMERKRNQRKVFYYSATAAGILLVLGSSIFLRSLSPAAGALVPGLPTIASHKPYATPFEENSTTSNGAGKNVAIKSYPTTTVQTGQPGSTITQIPGSPLIDSAVAHSILPLTNGAPEHKTAHIPATPERQPGKVPYKDPILEDLADSKTHQRTVLAGITVGYQKGFNAYAVNAPVISSFFQVNLNDKFALSLQPALAYNSVQKTSLGSSAYHANVETQVQQTTEMTPDGPIYNYNVHLSYDSVQVGNVIGSGYWQAELPLYAHYKITRRLSLFTGMALRYTGAIPITQQISHMPASHSYVLENQPQYLPQDVIDGIVSNAVPGTAYDPSTSEEMNRNGTSTLSVSYGLGLKFQVGKRLGLELLGNKNLSSFKNISNKDLRSMHQQPGLRMSVIYHFNTPSGK